MKYWVGFIFIWGALGLAAYSLLFAYLAGNMLLIVFGWVREYLPLFVVAGLGYLALCFWLYSLEEG